MDPGKKISAYTQRVDRALDAWLPAEAERPSTLHRAMRYSIFAGGKRLRPALCLAAAEACGGTIARGLPAACAVECVHTYSLIHDDLPCMDDDDMRRGRPTSHKVFGEGIAVLAGDALLTFAFALLAGAKRVPRYDAADFSAELARAAGSRFLVGGQVADLEAENKPSTVADLRFIHQGKTAAMIVASLRLGAMSASAPPRAVRALSEFGVHLGLAFQVVDDILDVTQTSEKLGKSAGKDVTSGKTTYPSVMGLDASKREASRLTRKALRALDPLGARADLLRAMAEKMLRRES